MEESANIDLSDENNSVFADESKEHESEFEDRMCTCTYYTHTHIVHNVL